MEIVVKNGADRLIADVQPSSQFVTVYCVYRANGETHEKPVATLARKRVLATDYNWRLYALDGTELGDGFQMVTTALRFIARGNKL